MEGKKTNFAQKRNGEWFCSNQSTMTKKWKLDLCKFWVVLAVAWTHTHTHTHTHQDRQLTMKKKATVGCEKEDWLTVNRVKAWTGVGGWSVGRSAGWNDRGTDGVVKVAAQEPECRRLKCQTSDSFLLPPHQNRHTHDSLVHSPPQGEQLVPGVGMQRKVPTKRIRKKVNCCNLCREMLKIKSQRCRWISFDDCAVNRLLKLKIDKPEND